MLRPSSENLDVLRECKKVQSLIQHLRVRCKSFSWQIRAAGKIEIERRNQYRTVNNGTREK